MDTLKRLRAALAGRYEVEHELGRGGMAVVYLARDLRLERRVAIKVFEREGASGEGTERFLREIRVAAQLQHPNILPVHESGEAEGLVYYVMPYVAGQSLRERLEQEGPLPIAEAVRIAREVALALDHAHGSGIVHRDIKPDNVLLSGGVAVVADFGIARALEQGGGRLTDTGLAIGTPNYMSPEQATALPTVDGRADIYALGCVLYEMLAGAPPFTGPTAQAVMARHSADAVPPLSTVREVPAALEAAVLKALAKLPGDRWGSARAFADALSSVVAAPADRRTGAPAHRRTLVRFGAGVSGALVVAAGVWLGSARLGGRSDGGADSLRSVAVLPFAVIGDTSQTAIADGLTEAVITGLVRVPGLRVPASSRVFAYRDRQDDVRGVGRALDVDAVVSATVQQAGGALRVTAELIGVVDGMVRWREQFDGELMDVFAVQDSITGRIVDALQLRLGAATRSALARGVRTRDVEAWQLYLRGRQATYELTLSGVERAIALYRQALARDSVFADAWVGLADAYSFYSQFGGLPPAEVTVEWRRAVERGIELDSLNGFGFALRAGLRAQYDWDWDGAWRDMQRAVRLSPASADVELNYGAFLNLVGEPESALTHMRRAVALDPTNSFLMANLCWRFLYVGMTDSAIAHAERALATDSTQWVASYLLTELYHDAGRRAEGRREADRVLRYAGDSLPVVLHWLAHYYGRSGQLERAREMLDRLRALARRQYVQATYVAVARLAVGDRSGALDAIEESVGNRDLDLSWDLIFAYEALNGEPRYEAARRRVFGDRRAPRGWPR